MELSSGFQVSRFKTCFKQKQSTSLHIPNQREDKEALAALTQALQNQINLSNAMCRVGKSEAREALPVLGLVLPD